MSLLNNIISTIFIGKEVGEPVSTYDYPKLKVWGKETRPVLKELERLNYLKVRYNKHNITYIIKKPITQEVVDEICY